MARSLIGPLTAFAAIGGVLWICLIAARSDTHPRTELRDVLWPSFHQGRTRASILVGGQVSVLASLGLLGLSPIWPGVTVAAQFAAALLGLYLLIGCLFIQRNAHGLLGRNGLGEDPVYRTLRYLLAWPIWYRMTLQQNLRHADRHVG